MRRTWFVSFIVLAASSVACTALLGDYTTNANVNSDGDGGPLDSNGCTAAQKTCSGSCVSKEDPNTGCATGECAACAATSNSAPACKAGACSFTCNDGFSDCDGNPSTGCETKTATDLAHCGACGAACGVANTANAPSCAQGKCAFACKVGFAHCGPDNASGCETDVGTSPTNCGACGHSCLGGACVAGKCEPFQVASATSPSGVAVDAKHVYFTSVQAVNIQRVLKDGKCTPAAPCPQDFVSQAIGDDLSQFRGPSSIVSDGANVWWIGQAISKVGRRSATLPPGPATSPILNFGPAQSTEPGYLVLAGGKIFWTSGFGSADPAPHVRKADLDGTNITTFATYAAPVTTFRGFGAITADATHVYWASEHSGVFRAAFNDPPCVEGSTCKSISGGGSAYGVAVDATFVYWTEPGSATIPGSGTIRRAPKAGGSSATVATNQDSPKAIAVQDGFVYWGNTGSTAATGGTIRRAPQVGGICSDAGCERVADATAPDAIVAADDGIYWTNNVPAGGVYRLAK